MSAAARRVTLLAHDSPEVAAFIATLEQRIQQLDPNTAWQVRCLSHPEGHSTNELFLWSHPLQWGVAQTSADLLNMETERVCRQALLHSGARFHVLQGTSTQRLETVMTHLGLETNTVHALARQFALNGGRTPWRCESCSDPDCEHRMFTALLGRS